MRKIKTALALSLVLPIVVCAQTPTTPPSDNTPPMLFKTIESVTPSGRITHPPVNSMNEELKTQYEKYLRMYGGATGPRMPLLNSPYLIDGWSAMQLALSKSPLDTKTREIGIAVVAAEWQSEFEWYVHSDALKRLGVSEKQIALIKKKKSPQFSNEIDQIAYDYARQLVGPTHQVDDTTYNRARELFGDQKLVDYTTLLGQYLLVSITLNAHKIPLPDSVKPAFNN